MRIGKTDISLTSLSEAEEVQEFNRSNYKRLDYYQNGKCSAYYKDMFGHVREDKLRSKMYSSTKKSRKFAYYLYMILGIMLVISPLPLLGLLFIGLALIIKNM